MKKQSIFKASFEESLNLLDDKVSSKLAQDYYQEALKKEKYRGTFKSNVWLVILTILFIIGPNWLIVAVNDYLFYHANSKDLTVPLPNINFLPYWVFWVGLAIWILLIILGKRFNQQFILIYRGQFHFMVSFIIWLFVELNLLSLNLVCAITGFWGVFTFVGLMLVMILSMVFSKCQSLEKLLYGENIKYSFSDKLFSRVFAIIFKYGGLVIAIWLVVRIFLQSPVENRNTLATGLGILFSILILNVITIAFEIYFIFPYMLQGYYKWKYPEEYRDWEGKTVEEWYGKKYLKKHKELSVRMKCKI